MAKKGEDWREEKGSWPGKDREEKWREEKRSEDKWREEKWSEDKWREEKRREEKRREEKRRKRRRGGVKKLMRDLKGRSGRNSRHWFYGRRSVNNWRGDIHEEKEWK